MRSLIHLKIFIVVFLTLISGRPAFADFETAAGYWKLLGQQKQVPQLLNLRGTEEIAILEVVGDCGGQLCRWGATRAELLYDANGRVIRWQAFLENGDDFHEFDSFLVNGELVMDYTGEIGDTGNFISATLSLWSKHPKKKKWQMQVVKPETAPGTRAQVSKSRLLPVV